MRVCETQLPGRGLRYVIRFDDDAEFTIVIRNDGRRIVYWRPGADADSEVLFESTEAEAEKIAEIFEGTYFHPVEADLDDALTDARIRWVHLPATSGLVGASIRENEIRRRTGVCSGTAGGSSSRGRSTSSSASRWVSESGSSSDTVCSKRCSSGRSSSTPRR